MIEAESQEGEELSLFAVGTTLLRNRWRIARWGLGGALVVLVLVIGKPALYLASASFMPQGTDPGRSALANLAGQFSLSLPSGSQSLTPEFYTRLLKARELLGRVARDTLIVPEMRGQRVAVADLLKVGEGPPKLREERGVKELSQIVSASFSRSTGVIDLTVATRWPSVSLAIATSLVSGVNEFNQRMRRDQAAAERKFVEARLTLAGTELRLAEDRLEQFLKNNRQFSSSPELSFTRDRLQRQVSLQQQVFTSLTQSYEELRMREVRDTPVITAIDQPSVPTMPEPRGRAVRVLLGLLLGAVAGAALVFVKEMTTRRREIGDAAADEFFAAFGEVKGGVLGRVRRLGGRAPQ